MSNFLKQTIALLICSLLCAATSNAGEWRISFSLSGHTVPAITTQAIVPASWIAPLPKLRHWASQHSRGVTLLFAGPKESSAAARIRPSKLPLNLITVSRRAEMLRQFSKLGIQTDIPRWLPDPYLQGMLNAVRSLKNPRNVAPLTICVRLRYLPLTFFSGVAGLYVPSRQVLRLSPILPRQVFLYIFAHELKHHLQFREPDQWKRWAKNSWQPLSNASPLRRLGFILSWAVALAYAVLLTFNMFDLLFSEVNNLAQAVGSVILIALGGVLSYLSLGQVRVLAHPKSSEAFIPDVDKPWSSQTMYSLAHPQEGDAELWGLMMSFPSLLRIKMRQHPALQQSVQTQSRQFLKDPLFHRRLAAEQDVAVEHRRLWRVIGLSIYTIVALAVLWPDQVAMVLSTLYPFAALLGLTIFSFLTPALVLRVNRNPWADRLPSNAAKATRWLAASVMGIFFEVQKLAFLPSLLAVWLLVTHPAQLKDLLTPRPAAFQAMVLGAYDETTHSPDFNLANDFKSAVHDSVQRFNKARKDFLQTVSVTPKPSAKYHVTLLDPIRPPDRLVAPAPRSIKPFPLPPASSYVLSPSEYKLFDSNGGISFVRNGKIVNSRPWEGVLKNAGSSHTAVANFQLPPDLALSEVESVDVEIGEAKIVNFGTGPLSFERASTSMRMFVAGTHDSEHMFAKNAAPGSETHISSDEFIYIKNAPDRTIQLVFYDDQGFLNAHYLLLVNPNEFVLKVHRRRARPDGSRRRLPGEEKMNLSPIKFRPANRNPRILSAS